METLLLQPAVPTPASTKVELKCQSPLVSYFRAPIQNVKPSECIDLEEVYRRITGTSYFAVTQSLRKLQDPKLQRSFKASRLDYVTFSGVFSKRCEEGLLEHSGLLVVDLDQLENLAEARQLLLNDKELATELLFTSPSGNGLKWVVECDLSQYSHSRYFQAVSSYLWQTYRLKADASGRDVSRACFLGYDPLAVLGIPAVNAENSLTL